MRKSFWIALAVLFVSVGAPNAHADSTRVFDVSGTAKNVGSPFLPCALDAVCPYSGTLTLDVTSGTVTAVDIIFPGYDFSTLLSSSPCCGTQWGIGVAADGAATLSLDFTPAPTPGSLVDFSGSNDVSVEVVTIETDNLVYLPASLGSITPAPEPSSLALVPVGLGALLVMRKRMSHGRPSAV